ncbi:L,D-transpeptidase [Legionella drozanskii]|uniref:Enhanced entry protein EnhA n=1 Tax=Legionella drozanskii LLAP-1 TaxID=1212489 RepID=A0A0W0SV97_9GAMM|nr:L,D-transpeptidase [Legionella drozanskii]KTC87264.1 enhanced entry protein EnhA [Legionella drozanskii LLAP-1]
MKKINLLPLLSSILLASCLTHQNMDVVTDDAGYPHYTIPYQGDTRGQAVFPMQRQATGEKLFIFDPKASAWAAYNEQGKRVMTGSASGGMDFCKDIMQSCRTVTGTYTVYDKKGADCKSSEFPISLDGHAGGAKMPYCMHFYHGYAIHAAYEVPTYNSSHGCIRVLPGAAKWLNENFIDVGTTVLVLPYA